MLNEKRSSGASRGFNWIDEQNIQMQQRHVHRHHVCLSLTARAYIVHYIEFFSIIIDEDVQSINTDTALSPRPR